MKQEKLYPLEKIEIPPRGTGEFDVRLEEDCDIKGARVRATGRAKVAGLQIGVQNKFAYTVTREEEGKHSDLALDKPIHTVAGLRVKISLNNESDQTLIATGALLLLFTVSGATRV